VSELDAARESIELALNPPEPASIGTVRRAIRRFSLRLGRPRAVHQHRVDRELLAASSAVERTLVELTTGLDELRRRVANSNVRLGAVEGVLGPIDAFVSASRSLPDYRALGLQRFEAEGAGKVIGYRNDVQAVAPSDDYVAFEDVFRLSEDVIRERQRPYLSLLDGRQPVLDVGCGRGEFLELLRADGTAARGVDLDPGMVTRARAKGLEVEQGDAVEYLENLPDRSLGAIFAAQVVEHLPYAQLIAFMRLAEQKLQPGGRLIVETVNPHAPGALKNFWLDLTHQHPIFPEVLLTLCRGIGFDSAYVFHPGASGDAEVDRQHAGDYAIVAERAGAG
jgi:SAM-dependent methyltransferase